MSAAKVTFDMARRIALTLPGVEEGSMYGSPALRRLLACLAINKSAEPDSLVVRTGFDERAAQLAEEPATYYVTNHYLNHPVIALNEEHSASHVLSASLWSWQLVGG